MLETVQNLIEDDRPKRVKARKDLTELLPIECTVSGCAEDGEDRTHESISLSRPGTEC